MKKITKMKLEDTSNEHVVNKIASPQLLALFSFFFSLEMDIFYV